MNPVDRPGQCCGDARDRNIDDVGFIRALVAEVRSRLPIDGTRIFATGMSNGGMLSHRLACDAADLFRAIASVAGTDAFRDPSKVFSFVSVPDTLARWAMRNHCSPSPRRTVETPGAYCEAYSGCAGNTRLQLCVTDSGGHSWPGTERVRRGKEPASQAIDATDVIWAFFVEASR